MLQTPREAILEAENARLKAENEYLRRSVGAELYSLDFTPIAAVAEMEVSRQAETITLPCAASIRGNLSRHGNYHVMTKLRYAEPEDLCIQYHAPADIIKSNAVYALNELLPRLHEQFIRHLATEVRRVCGVRAA
jgi:hypothetical protein